MSGSDMFADLRDLYQEVILDHGRKPRNFRRLEDASRTARGDNPMCGDRMELFVSLGTDGAIADAAFQGRQNRLRMQDLGAEVSKLGCFLE